MADELDITEYTLPRTDQLNAEDLEDGPITVTVERVEVPGGREQPIHVHLSGGHQPFKPCLTCRKQLKAGWGHLARYWVGKTIRLWRDPDVNSPDGTRGVGGVRIQGMSHISAPLSLPLRTSRGKKKRFTIAVIKTNDATLEEVLKAEGLTVAAVDAWLVGQGQKPYSTHPQAHGGLIRYLTSGNGEGFDFIRAHMREVAPPQKAAPDPLPLLESVVALIKEVGKSAAMDLAGKLGLDLHETPPGSIVDSEKLAQLETALLELKAGR